MPIPEITNQKQLVAENMKFCRLRLKMTCEELGYELNISRSTVTSYEQGYSEPPLRILKEIKRLTGISIDAILEVDLRKNFLENESLLNS